MDIVDLIIRYECGELVLSEQAELFSELIRSGRVWKMQGVYGRQARNFIDSGLIDEKGNIDKKTLRMYIQDVTLKQE